MCLLKACYNIMWTVFQNLAGDWLIKFMLKIVYSVHASQPENSHFRHYHWRVCCRLQLQFSLWRPSNCIWFAILWQIENFRLVSQSCSVVEMVFWMSDRKFWMSSETIDISVHACNFYCRVINRVIISVRNNLLNCT